MRAREEREGETVRRTEGSVKKPRQGCLYVTARTLRPTHVACLYVHLASF
jgi:hypothetical protein